MSDNTWDPGVANGKQPWCQTVVEYTYWLVLVSFNKCNTIQFKNKTTSSEYFYGIHKVDLDVISDNIASLDQSGK